MYILIIPGLSPALDRHALNQGRAVSSRRRARSGRPAQRSNMYIFIYYYIFLHKLSIPGPSPALDHRAWRQGRVVSSRRRARSGRRVPRSSVARLVRPVGPAKFPSWKFPRNGLGEGL